MTFATFREPWTRIRWTLSADAPLDGRHAWRHWKVEDQGGQGDSRELGHGEVKAGPTLGHLIVKSSEGYDPHGVHLHWPAVL